MSVQGKDSNTTFFSRGNDTARSDSWGDAFQGDAKGSLTTSAAIDLIHKTREQTYSVNERTGSISPDVMAIVDTLDAGASELDTRETLAQDSARKYNP